MGLRTRCSQRAERQPVDSLWHGALSDIKSGQSPELERPETGQLKWVSERGTNTMFGIVALTCIDQVATDV